MLALCQKWHCPPSVVMKEPAASWRMVRIADMGKVDTGE